MAEAGQEEEEHTFPLKRKPQDIPAEEAIAKSHEDDVNKKQKLSNTDSSLAQENKVGIDEEEDEDDYEGEDEEDEDEESNGEAEVDRKGKGILRDDKGKGKLIEDSDDDDSSDFGSESDVDSDTDLSDDLLAEIDLGNIIPSRTRRRTHQSGLKISDDPLKEYHHFWATMEHLFLSPTSTTLSFIHLLISCGVVLLTVNVVNSSDHDLQLSTVELFSVT